MGEIIRLLAATACGLFIGGWIANHFQPIHGYDDLAVYKITDWPNRRIPWVGECYYSGRDAYCAADKRSAAKEAGGTR